MEVSEVKSHIKNKQFDSFYIFAGEEWKVQRIYIEQIAKASNKTMKYIDSIADIYSKLSNKSFIKKSYVYVVRDDKEILSNDTLQSKISDILNDDILILILTTIDKRTKFYKTFNKQIVEFEPLKPEILKKYIKKEINLSDKNCDKLMEVCDFDYGRILLEIDKIKCYQSYDEDKELLSDVVFKYLLENGTIHTPSKDAIFDLIDSILDDDINCFNLYQQCLDVGEAVMVMLKVLYDNAKATLQVQSCNSKDISKSTGLNSWQIKNAMKHKGVYSNRELINIMMLCQDCQKGIVTGTMSEEFVMPYIMVNVLGGF